MTDKKSKIHVMSRRSVLQSLAGAGVLASMSGLPGLSNSAWANATLAQKPLVPKRGGRIRVASISMSTADTLDPAKGSLSTDYARHYMLYSGLTQYDENLAAFPALAETLETDDQTLWTLSLRKGVVFHDGKPLTPADVVYSLLRHKDPATSSKVAPVAAQFASVTASGPSQVQIQLTGPNVDLPVILASSQFLIIQDGTTDFLTAVGTGPYKLKEFTPGIRTIAVRHENYWKPGRPYLDEIELIGIPDESSRVNALLAGDVQLISAVDARSTRRIRKSSNHDVLEVESSLFTDLIMRSGSYPTNNPDFVLAIKYLFDRELIKRALFRGYGTIANDHPVHPNNPYFAADLPQRQYDPDRARFHLQKAGITKGSSLPVFASPAAAGSVDIASLLQLSAMEAGLKLGVNRVSADGYWSSPVRKQPLSFGNINPRPSLDLMFSLFFKSDAPWNQGQWQNEYFDQMLLAARGEADEARRKQMYVDMQVLIHNEGQVGIPVFINLIDGYDTRLKGLGGIPIGGLMGYSFADYVWLDS